MNQTVYSSRVAYFPCGEGHHITQGIAPASSWQGLLTTPSQSHLVCHHCRHFSGYHVAVPA